MKKLIQCPTYIKKEVIKTWKKENCYYDASLELGISEPTVRKIIKNKKPIISYMVIEKIKDKLKSKKERRC